MEFKCVISPNFEKLRVFFFIFCIFDSNFVFSVSLTDKFNQKTYISPLCDSEDNNNSIFV